MNGQVKSLLDDIREAAADVNADDARNILGYCLRQLKIARAYANQQKDDDD